MIEHLITNAGGFLATAPGEVVFIVKMTALLGVAWLLWAALARANPRWRTLLWRATALGLVALPVLHYAPAAIRLEVQGPALERGSAPPATDDPAPAGRPPAASQQEATTTPAVPASERSTDGEAPRSESAGAGRAAANSPSLPIGAEDHSPALAGKDRNWSRWPLLGSIWAFGFVFLAIRYAIGYATVRRWIRQSESTEPGIEAEFRRCAERMRLGANIEVRRSDQAPGPLLAGLRRPVLLLPSRLCGAEDAARRSAVFAHELSHLGSRDLAWGTFIHWVMLVAWPHPLTWPVRSAYAAACERVCDAVAADALGDREAYSQTLAHLALQLGSVPPVAGGAPMARTSKVAGRIEALRRGLTARAIPRRVLAVSSAFSVLSLVSLGALRLVIAEPQAGAGAQTEERSAGMNEDATGRTFLFRVVDGESGEPLAGVPVKTRIDRDETDRETNERGELRIELPEEDPPELRLEVRSDPHVPTRVQWRNRDHRDPIPSQYTLRLERGTTIGGLILDEQGDPIAGAEVELLVPGRNTTRERVSIWEEVVRTDEEGRWRHDQMPSDLSDVWIKLGHEDFISDSTFGQTPKPPIERLRDRTGVMVMKKGHTVIGRVLGSSGGPIDGAYIYQGADRFGSDYPMTRSDEEGRFVFEQSKPGEMILTVRAVGHAPDLRRVIVEPDMAPLEFRLESGHRIDFRVVDPQGNPIEGARMAPDTWRGYRSLQPSGTGRTNSQGIKTWHSAPADEVIYDIVAAGYISKRQVPMTARAEPYEITLRPSLNLSGRVVDAETQQPIADFIAIPGIDFENGNPIHWERRRGVQGREGRYRFTFGEQRVRHVRIEADGYRPGVSPTIALDQGDQTYDFELVRGAGPSGIVLSASGEPLAGVPVVMARAGETVFLSNGRVRLMDSYHVKTDDAGRFSFPGQDKPFKLAVAHATGYLEIDEADLTAQTPLRLQPWGRVEGSVMIGSDPAPGHQVEVTMEGSNSAWRDLVPEIRYGASGVTDEEGRFSLDRVRPGEVRVHRVVVLIGSATGPRTTTYSHGVTAEVLAGETVQVVIGGTGRPVTGRVRVPEDYDEEVDWSFYNSGFSRRTPKIPYPEDFEAMGPEAGNEWYARWLSTAEGKAHTRERRQFGLKIANDGTFRVDDIPAGKYRLHVTLQEPPPVNVCGFGDALGSTSLEFEVPPMADGRSDEPFDLSAHYPDALVLELFKQLKVGDLAPDFTVGALDGKEITLADFRGRTVLLDFWAVWCAPCLAETPHLVDVYERFGSDPRFAMIGLNLDPAIDTPKQYTDENAMEWIQGFLGEWSKAELPAEFGVRSIPSIILIDPEGRVIEKGLRGPGIAEAVEKALEGN